MLLVGIPCALGARLALAAHRDGGSTIPSRHAVFESPVVGQLSRCASAAARARQRGTLPQLHRHHNRSTSFPPRDAQRRRLSLRTFSRPRPAPRSSSTGAYLQPDRLDRHHDTLANTQPPRTTPAPT